MSNNWHQKWLRQDRAATFCAWKSRFLEGNAPPLFFSFSSSWFLSCSMSLFNLAFSTMSFFSSLMLAWATADGKHRWDQNYTRQKSFSTKAKTDDNENSPEFFWDSCQWFFWKKWYVRQTAWSPFCWSDKKKKKTSDIKVLLWSKKKKKWIKHIESDKCSWINHFEVHLSH